MSFTKHLDVRYSKTTEIDLRLDIWTPDGVASDTPFVVFIHGFNTNKSASNFDIVASAICNAGIAWASIEYDMAAVLPNPVQQFYGAVRFLRAEHNTYNIKINKCAFMGSSLGSHIATIAACSSDVSGIVGSFGGHTSRPNNAQALVAVSGALMDPDLTNLGTDAYAFMSAFYGCASLASCGNTATYLPQYRMDATDPPMLGIFGDADTDMPVAHGVNTVAAWDAVAHNADIIINSGTGHGFANATLQKQAILDFLASTIG